MGSGPPPAGLNQIEDVVARIISVVVDLGFITMMVMLIWSGFKFLTSSGEPKAIQAASHTFTWAIFGLIFMAVAWLILQLIYSFTGVQVTVFDVKSLCVIGGHQFCSPTPSP